MTTSTEAPASVTYSLITPNGFPVLFTVRAESGTDLMIKMTKIETELKLQNYKPQEKKSFGGNKTFAKPTETVEGRVCPKCKQALVYRDIKGQKVVKCSTNKWNPQTRQAEGCDYIEWPDRKPIQQAPKEAEIILPDDSLEQSMPF